MNKTVIAVLLFIVLLVVAGYSRADDGLRVGVGKALFNSHMTAAEVGYEYNNWEASATIFGEGDTKRGEQNFTPFYSLSYLTRPENFNASWAQPFLRLGVSYNDGSPLVGSTNFRLGIGADFSDVWRIEYIHYSSAGIHSPNTGVDAVLVSYLMPYPWSK